MPAALGSHATSCALPAGHHDEPACSRLARVPALSRCSTTANVTLPLQAAVSPGLACITRLRTALLSNDPPMRPAKSKSNVVAVVPTRTVLYSAVDTCAPSFSSTCRSTLDVALAVMRTVLSDEQFVSPASASPNDEYAPVLATCTFMSPPRYTPSVSDGPAITTAVSVVLPSDAPPDALASRTTNVFADDSQRPSSMIGMLKLRLVTPLANVSVPDCDT